MEKFNPYEILGVSSSATEAEIKAAARALYRTVHPDNGGTEESFHRVRLAEQLLLDAGRRAKFDAHGTVDEPGPDQIRATALQIIAGSLDATMNAYLASRQSGADPRRHDIVANFRLQISERRRKLVDDLEDAREAIEFVKDFAKRFKSADGDWAASLFRTKEQNIAAAIAGMEMQVAAHDEATRILEACQFDFDRVMMIGRGEFFVHFTVPGEVE